MIQVSADNNQLKVVEAGKTSFYSFELMKSISYIEQSKFRPNNTSSKDYVVLIHFNNENINSPLRLNLAKVTNQVTWTNNPAGAEVAVDDLSVLRNTALNPGP